MRTNLFDITRKRTYILLSVFLFSLAVIFVDTKNVDETTDEIDIE